MATHFIQPSLLKDPYINPIEKISGLTYIPDYITQTQETELLRFIDNQLWLADLKRRVQHYGYKYDYTARRVDASMRLESIPGCLQDYCTLLHSNGLLAKIPDQVIINEYQPGQGIASHIDCVPCFHETIASISLGSPCVMDFVDSQTQEKIPVLLEPRSVFVIQGDARYRWKHGIAPRKTDRYNGMNVSRGRRVSLTFRNVILL